MIKMRRKIRPILMYVALFLVMFGVGFAVAKTTETTSALDQEKLLEFSQNNILFYNPDDDGDKCVSTTHFAGNELTWEDLNPLTMEDRLKLMVQTYGEFAMDLQRWYGIPWEMPFGVMIFESNIGADVPYSPSNKAKEVGMFEMMGLVDSSWLNKDFSNGNAEFRDPYASTIEQTPSICSEETGSCAPGAPPPTQTHTYKNYETISKMMLGYVLHHVSSNHGVPTTINGVTYDSPYEAGLHLLEPQTYADNLHLAVDLLMRPYCTREDGTSCYSDNLYGLISGTMYPQLREVAEANGWKSSTELAVSEDLPAGGYWRAEHGWGDIRSAVWNTYGEAGLPSAEASRYGATTTTTQNGSVSAEVGGNSVLHSPTHDWLDGLGIEGYHKNEISLTGANGIDIDYNVVRDGQYLDYAPDAGNGSGLPGFIVLHLSSASNFGARNWTNFTATTPSYDPVPNVTIYVPPHFTIDAKNREVFQHFPLSHPSAAVSVRYDTPDGEPFISDRYGVQIEIVGHGGTPDKTCMPSSCDDDYIYTNFSEEEWDYIASILVAISNETGIPLTSTLPWVRDYNDSPNVKLSTDELRSYIGVLGHEHINGKWDPLAAWEYVEPALERINYSYVSDSSFSTCGTASHRGSCISFDDVYDGGCTEDGYSFYWQSGKSWMNYPIRTCSGGNPTIGGGGCGYAALANIVTNLTGERVTPIDIVNVARSASSSAFFACGEGSDGSMPKGVLDTNSYGLSYEFFQNNDNFNVEYINAVLDRNGGGKSMILFTLGSGPLAYAGHWVVIRGKTPDGKWKMFTTSTWYEGQYEVYDVNDKIFDPNVIVNAHVAWRSYWYVISKQ